MVQDYLKFDRVSCKTKDGSKKGGRCEFRGIVDSTTIKVCHIKREKQHKVFDGLAKKSQSTMGWFFGFKLHIVVNG